MKNIFHSCIKALLILGIAASSYVHAADPLKVGLYPFVPRLEQFQTAIQNEWKKIQPNVDLIFETNWDGGYDQDPPDDVDVFVFDAMYFENFLSRGFLESLEANEISNLDDFLEYAIKGVQSNGKYYAIPQLGCANVLFYKKNDDAIANAKSIDELKSALNQCTYTSQIPPDERGLMIDMVGGITNATLYLDIAHGTNNKFPFPLPPSKENIDPAVIQAMKDLLSIASFRNATEDSPAYERANWFSNGFGRAVVGYTESMSKMSDETLNKISFKPLPRSNDNYSPVFYADVIGINTKSRSRGMRELAVQLANVMASKEVMIASIGVDATNSKPQYLMATRPSIFMALGNDFPIYNKMYSMVESNSPIMFKLSANSKEWLKEMKKDIRSAARDHYACGCDQLAISTIANNDAAKEICTKTCNEFGGWNGQWTNQPPAALSGSVCGCNSCTSINSK